MLIVSAQLITLLRFIDNRTMAWIENRLLRNPDRSQSTMNFRESSVVEGNGKRCDPPYKRLHNGATNVLKLWLEPYFRKQAGIVY